MCWRVCAGLLVALLPLLAVLSSNPACHRLFHPDAQTPAHECILSVLAEGKALVADAAADPAPPSRLLLAVARWTPSALVGQIDVRLAPSRAPPVGVSSLVG